MGFANRALNANFHDTRRTLDVDRREVSVNENSVELTTKFEVLRTLMEHVGIVMNPERVAADALGYSFGGDTNNNDEICSSARKIDDRYIKPHQHGPWSWICHQGFLAPETGTCVQSLKHLCAHRLSGQCTMCAPALRTICRTRTGSPPAGRSFFLKTS